MTLISISIPNNYVHLLSISFSLCSIYIHYKILHHYLYSFLCSHYKSGIVDYQYKTLLCNNYIQIYCLVSVSWKSYLEMLSHHSGQFPITEDNALLSSIYSLATHPQDLQTTTQLLPSQTSKPLSLEHAGHIELPTFRSYMVANPQNYN